MAEVTIPRVLATVSGGVRSFRVTGDTLARALESLFESQPQLRVHLLNERGEIRPHVVCFVDGRRASMDDPVTEQAEITVLQAVSGG
jgi:hypothetical protein